MDFSCFIWRQSARVLTESGIWDKVSSSGLVEDLLCLAQHTFGLARECIQLR